MIERVRIEFIRVFFNGINVNTQYIGAINFIIYLTLYIQIHR